MKKKFPNLAEWMIGTAFVGLIIMGGVIVSRAIEPPPVQFKSIDIKNSPKPGELLIVEASVRRTEKLSCTNGVQVDSRDEQGVEARLPVPTRQVLGQHTQYAIVIPTVTHPGTYGLRVRETVYCDGRPRIAETPWLAFEVMR